MADSKDEQGRVILLGIAEETPVYTAYQPHCQPSQAKKDCYAHANDEGEPPVLSFSRCAGNGSLLGSC
jgi:hypothetical protein